MKRPYELRALFELRKSNPLGPRPGVGRLFFAQGLPGLVDASACVWPVQLSRLGKMELSEGDILQFECLFERVDGQAATKYQDEGYNLVLTRLVENVQSHSSWPSAVLKSPLPGTDAFSRMTDTQQTNIFPSPLRERKKLLQGRELALAGTRGFFQNRDFFEMQTPTLVPSGGVENYLNSFATQYEDHRGQLWPLALPTSPEFALKKLMAEGFPRVFQLARSFRNIGELSKWHEPEFTMLEWYRVGARMENVIRDTEELVTYLAETLGSSKKLPAAWPVFRVDELFDSLMGLQLEDLQSTEDFYNASKSLSPSLRATDDWDVLFSKLFMERVEPFLTQQIACFVTHYPVQQSALAQREDGGKPYLKRFEAYLEGIEICNGYQELTDAHDLANRFDVIASRRTDVARDAIFEQTMEFGLPPCAGNALGFDRVACVLLGANKMADITAIPFISQFPTDTVAKE